ncbi:MAG: stage II sporulation protein R [Oscillospiraceae bacterium]|nr:stage II sporulation protein R [Oscillospiraceae bacterium]
MRKLETAMALALIASIFIGNFVNFSQKLKNLQQDVLRLHILANSDSEQDQNLKLQVRDALLEQSELLFAGCESLEDMKTRAIEQQETIQKIAKDTLEQQGCYDDVQVQLVSMQFDTREYENFTMPAGNYDAVRILIGNAEGHNWWCVMYPPLCLPVAEPENYFDDETVELLEYPQQYEIKFKCVELWEKFTKKSES